MGHLPMPKLLIVDDEPAIQKLLQRGLSGYGYNIVVVDNGRAALEMVTRQPPDLIVLDIELQSRPDGLDVCRQLRLYSRTPVIMLTVRDEKQIKLQALNAGADDYITKPFDMDELDARIRAVLRRADEKARLSPGEIHVHQLSIDLTKRRVSLRGEEIHLTPTEYELLRLFATHPGKVLTFDVLLSELQRQSVASPSRHRLRVFVNTLRKKLKDDPTHNTGRQFIFNEPGIGYRFTDLS